MARMTFLGAAMVRDDLGETTPLPMTVDIWRSLPPVFNDFRKPWIDKALVSRLF